MSRAAFVSVWCAAVAAQDPAAGAGPVAVEVAPSATTAWVHQPITVVVSLSIDRQFFATQAVPLFQQKLDQPFQVTVPWLFAAEDRAVEFVPPPPGALGQRIAVGDAVVVAALAGTAQRGGRAYDVLQLRYRWTPLAPGTSAIAPIELRYAFATRFQEDFLRGRQPLDRQETSVLSAPARLQVRALPTAGRPAGFTGAVGDFTVTARTDVASVALGGSFALSVAVTGDGNLDRFAAMPAPPLAGYHVQGMVERRAGNVRTFVFDVVALREGDDAVPAVSFVAFSPTRGEYVTHVAGPVPLAVLPAAGPIDPRIRSLIDAAASEGRTRTVRMVATVAAFLVLLVLGLRGVRRRRRRRGEALRAAYEQLAAAREPLDVQRAFEALCAVSAGHQEFDPDATWRALLSTEAREALVADAQRVHMALDAARFGGESVARDELLRVAAALRAHGEVVAT